MGIQRLVRGHRAGVALLALVLLLVVGVGGFAVYLNDKVNDVPRFDLGLDEPGTDRPNPATGTAGEAVDVLLAGVDAGEKSRIVEDLADGEWTPGSHRSDVIMVLHLTADREQAYVISIPRDTWVTIDGHGDYKINAALSLGGPSLFVHTIEQFTALRMDHLAIIDWNGFKDLTDALGGVTVEQDGQTVRMDGQEALEYVRVRKTLPRGDFDRIQRQQNVMRNLSQEMLEAGTVTNPIRLTSVVRAVTANIAVDDSLDGGRMRALALSMRKLTDDDVTYLTVPVKGTGRVGNQSVVFVDRPAAAELFGAAFEDELDQYVATHDVEELPPAGQVD